MKLNRNIALFGALAAAVLCGVFFAESLWRRADGIIPGLIIARRVAASGQNDKAINLYTTLAAEHPNNGQIYFERGKLYAQKGDFPRSLSDMSRCIDLGYPDAMAHAWRGVIYGRHMGRPDLQEKEASAAIAADTLFADGYYLRAQARAKLKKTREALADINAAIGLDPADAGFYFERADIKAGLKDYAQAKSDLEAALKIEPAFGRAHGLLGKILLSEGNYLPAVGHLDKALTLENKAREYLLWRGLAREKLGNFKGALDDYVDFLDFQQEAPKDRGFAFNRIAAVFYKTGHFQDAKEAVNQAMEILPERASLYELRGRIEFESGSFGEALDDFKRALILQPKAAARITHYIGRAEASFKTKSSGVEK